MAPLIRFDKMWKGEAYKRKGPLVGTPSIGVVGQEVLKEHIVFGLQSDLFILIKVFPKSVERTSCESTGYVLAFVVNGALLNSIRDHCRIFQKGQMKGILQGNFEFKLQYMETLKFLTNYCEPPLLHKSCCSVGSRSVDDKVYSESTSKTSDFCDTVVNFSI